MMKFILVLFAILCSSAASAQRDPQASEALIKRIVPNHYDQFAVQFFSKATDNDSFEIEAKGQKIILRGNNGVSVASALYYYLKNYCHAQITWNGTNMHLPARLPMPRNIVRKSSPYKYRYYLNYCTFNYSMSWWDWPRWQKEVDWMALHGINMPLAITGEAYTWYLVYKDMGFTDEELKPCFCGPSYFAWFWMGNLDGWGGPLPLRWMKSHAGLQKQIIERERALGMTPVLPAFTGHVPQAFKKRFPLAKLKTTNWHNGFGDTYILDAHDSLFAAIGKRFLKKQTEMFGSDHLYSADTFNENEPPSDEPAYLNNLSTEVYNGMKEADTAAVWVMQGWLFFSDRKFWKLPQIQSLLNAVPDNKMIVLDLASEIEPVWKRTNAFFGKPWIWNMLNNFGGNTNLFGRMQTVAIEPAKALNDRASGKLQGIGLTMEAIEQNPVMYELMMDNTWRRERIDLNKWLPGYVLNRYGHADGHALKAWNILLNTVYTVPPDKYKRDGAESIIEARPTFDSSTKWANTRLNYSARDLLPAWDEMIKAIPECKNSDGFQFDLVDVTRQVLANYATPLQQQFVKAYKINDEKSFIKYGRQFITLIEDMDRLLSTRKDFLLGPWVAGARKWGKDEKEKALYEFNAKDLITLWGDKNCPLNEYSCRQWSGLLNDFYKPRWEKFFAFISTEMKAGKQPDLETFIRNIKDWEWNWVNARKDYKTTTNGDPVSVAKQMYLKYRTVVGNAYK